MDSRLTHIKIEACDVDNPLVGIRGASFVFGRQKGADLEMMKELDENLNIMRISLNNTYLATYLKYLVQELQEEWELLLQC